MSIADFNQMSHFLYDYIKLWAAKKPEGLALIDADTHQYFSWQEFDNAINMIALQLTEDGWQKGDIMVSILPLLPQHIFFEYACFRLGIIFCPLDVRLKEHEVLRSIKMLESARRIGFLHPDNTDGEDKWGRKKFYEFNDFAKKIRRECPFVKDFIIFSPEEDAELNSNTVGILEYTRNIKLRWLQLVQNPDLMEKAMAKLDSRADKVLEEDPILIIFTTGTTGIPKPAMLTNVGIVAQNFCMAKGFAITEEDRMLVNLPPSHVGCQTEQLMTTIFTGGISVILHAFKADKTLKAIEQYKITIFGQIPSLFMMEWVLPLYKQIDLSSLRYALYGGQAVSRQFLEKLKQMAPYFGSGLGLTEMSGFVSYTPVKPDLTVQDVMSGLGHDYPLTPLTIRKPMNPDGVAGECMPDGETGEVCYSGPQVFLGYYGNEEATRKAISTDGVCYTGDLGFHDSNGLHLVGRSKLVIKPKGYQVYPPEIEQFIEQLPGVYMAAVLGYRHEVHSEGIVAFVQPKKKSRGRLTEREISNHCKSLASYKRPALIVLLDEIPLNRVDKTDYQELKSQLPGIIEEERKKGGWDAEYIKKMNETIA